MQPETMGWSLQFGEVTVTGFTRAMLLYHQLSFLCDFSYIHGKLRALSSHSQLETWSQKI
jgi:hypothetical protein